MLRLERRPEKPEPRCQSSPEAQSQKPEVHKAHSHSSPKARSPKPEADAPPCEIQYDGASSRESPPLPPPALPVRETARARGWRDATAALAHSTLDWRAPAPDTGPRPAGSH